MSVTAYKDHPLSELFPLMEDSELEELAADIRQNTQRAPITLYQGKILDGRNRYRACKIANVEPKVRHFTSGDAQAFILSVNVFRRHLTASQRALVAAKLSNGSHGGSRKQDAPVHLETITTEKAAEKLDVSPRTVATAKEVLKTAPRKEIAKIERGEKTVKEVARETKKKAEAKDVHLDKTGYPIPETILSEWSRAAAFDSTLREISKVKSIVEKATEDKDPIFGEVGNAAIAHLKNAYSDLTCVIPHAVCTSCQGRIPGKCTLCMGRGFISKFRYSLVPVETRRMREKKA